MSQNNNSIALYPFFLGSHSSKIESAIKSRYKDICAKAYGANRTNNGSIILFVPSTGEIADITFEQCLEIELKAIEKAASLSTNPKAKDYPLYEPRVKQILSRFYSTIDHDSSCVVWVADSGCVKSFLLVSTTPLKYYWLSQDRENVISTKPPRKNEEHLQEEDLRLWLITSGVEVESQVVTTKHRLDLWIPGKMILELKVAKVAGDDVCQAIDYYSRYQRTVLLVGSGLTSSASRGIEGFNRSTQSSAISFVTWNAVKPYLASVLSLNTYGR